MASFPTAGATLMPLAIAAFRSAHPDVTLSLVEGEPEELIPRLRDGEFDLGLIFEFGGPGEPGPGLQSSPLFEDPMKLALPKGHRLTARSASRSRTSQTRPGCRPPRPAPARATWCASAAPRDSSRASPSRATTI